MDNREAQAVTYEQSGHVEYVCDKSTERCEHGSCGFCNGWFGCTECNSFEGATTTHCPKDPMTVEESNKVYAGKLDYRDGEWVKEGSPHTTNRGWPLYWNPRRELHYHKDPVTGTLPCRSEYCTFDPKTLLFNMRQTEYDIDNSV